jgi:type IV secretory pathway TrbD component
MADDAVHTDGAPAPPPGEPVHLPGPSYLPVLTALGLTLAVTGVVLSWVLSGIGLVITVVAVWRWIRETRRDISELPLEH